MGFCSKHYMRNRRNGDPLTVKRVRVAVTSPVCLVDLCERKSGTRGWCTMHYSRWRETGELSPGRRHRNEAPESDRFETFVDRSSPNGCWEWTGGLTGRTGNDPNAGGYGRFRSGNRTVLSHRFAYEFYVGPIGEGLTIDHLCRNRKCCNPEHLEPVTHHENVLRGESLFAINARKTHCIHGHEFTRENTKLVYRAGTARRLCKECKRASNRAWARANRNKLQLRKALA